MTADRRPPQRCAVAERGHDEELAGETRPYNVYELTVKSGLILL